MSRLLKILMLVAALVAGVIAALMMHGCATTGQVVADCKPASGTATADELWRARHEVESATNVAKLEQHLEEDTNP